MQTVEWGLLCKIEKVIKERRTSGA